MRDPNGLRADRRLAINGGAALFGGTPEEDTGIVAEAAETVAEIVRSRRTAQWGGGPYAKRLERAFAEHIGRSRAFFHNSGTAALHTALFALGIGKGDAVALSDSGFVASLNVIYHLGARPVFLPSSPDTMLCVDDVAEWVDGIDVHTSLITHFLGNVADVEAIHRSAGSAHLVEDGGQAHGATLRGRPVGSFGDIGSFAGSHKKLVTAGQGGLNVYDDDKIDWRMRTYAHHGKDGAVEGVFPGHNFRGGDMEAALALAALEQLDDRVARRNAVADRLTTLLREAGLQVAGVRPGLDATASWFDVAVVMDEGWYGHRDWLVEALNKEGIPAWIYPSLITMPWVKPWMSEQGWWTDREEHLLETESQLWGRTFVLPTQISLADAKRIADGTVEVLTR